MFLLNACEELKVKYLGSEALGRSPVATPDSGANTNDFGVNGTGNTPLLLNVEFGEGILFVDGRLGNVPDGGLLDHVPDEEPLDGLVLGHEPGAVDTADALDASPALFVASVISSLGRLFCSMYHEPLQGLV